MKIDECFVCRQPLAVEVNVDWPVPLDCSHPRCRSQGRYRNRRVFERWIRETMIGISENAREVARETEEDI